MPNNGQTDTSVRHLLKPLVPYLKDGGVTEIVINRPYEIFIEKEGQWETHNTAELSFQYLRSLGTAVASYMGENLTFDSTRPILSAVLPDGERAQFVMPPACSDKTISVTIRKPNFDIRTIESFEKKGFFDKIRPLDSLNSIDQELKALYAHIHDEHNANKWRSQFLIRAVELQKNIVIAGATGSGKTTFMKALMQCIPTDQRIITIEDVPELVYGLPNHKNQVNLFYPSEAKDNATVTASTLLRSCLRMKPDRILLAELRGGETFDFLNVCFSGHGGSITSCHSGSCYEVFEYLALKVLQSDAGKTLSYEVVKKLLGLVIDVVVHIHNDKIEGRYITEIWFDPDSKRGLL